MCPCFGNCGPGCTCLCHNPDYFIGEDGRPQGVPPLVVDVLAQLYGRQDLTYGVAYNAVSSAELEYLQYTLREQSYRVDITAGSTAWEIWVQRTVT